MPTTSPLTRYFCERRGHTIFPLQRTGTHSTKRTVKYQRNPRAGQNANYSDIREAYGKWIFFASAEGDTESDSKIRIALDRFIEKLGTPRRKARTVETYEALQQLGEELHYSFRMTCWLITLFSTIPIFYYLWKHNVSVRDLCPVESGYFDRIPNLAYTTSTTILNLTESSFCKRIIQLLLFLAWVELSNRGRYRFYIHILSRLWRRNNWVGGVKPSLLCRFDDRMDYLLGRTPRNRKCTLL